MPLFKTSPHETTPPPSNEVNGGPRRKSTLFGRHRSVSPHSTTDQSYRTRNSDRSLDDSSVGRAGSTRSGGFFSRFGGGDGGFPHNDPSIMAARQKVSDAEEAEREADRALIAARNMVMEARDHVKFLEKEAEDDARRAKVKQAEAKVVSKSARALGRHG